MQIAINMKVIEQCKKLEQIVKDTLHMASLSSDSSEVSITKTIGISIGTRKSEIENVEFNNDHVLCITVFCQKRKGSASSTDLSHNAIARTVEAALNIARHTSIDPFSGIADKELLAFDAPDLDLLHAIDLDIDYGIKLSAKAEKTALSFDKNITHSEGGIFNNHYRIIVFANSHGILQSYCSSLYSLSCCVIAEKDGKMERDYSYSISRKISDLKNPELIGKECASRALSRLNPVQLSTKESPVLFAAEVATGLFRHLVSAINGDNIYRKSTFLLDSINRQILPHWLTIEEKPHLLGGLASSPFDKEGVLTVTRDIVKEGVLQTYLLSSYSSRQLSLKSTGHAGGIYNWIISHQGKDFTDMLKQLDTGFLVTELMGDGINIVTGDYSRGAAGFWVDNGKIQYPVSGITIAGNLKSMLRYIISIGNDIETRSNIQCGSVLLPPMQIAGK